MSIFKIDVFIIMAFRTFLEWEGREVERDLEKKKVVAVAAWLIKNF